MTTGRSSHFPEKKLSKMRVAPPELLPSNYIYRMLYNLDEVAIIDEIQLLRDPGRGNYQLNVMSTNRSVMRNYFFL